MKKVIIFDFDGTIADTLGISKDILYNLAPKYGYRRLTDAESEAMRDYTIQEVFAQMKLPLYKLPFMVRDVKNELHKQIGTLKPIPGMDIVLNKLKDKGYTLALITSNDKENVKTFLKRNTIEYFDYVYTGTSIFGKARVIQGFLHTYHLSNEEVVYVGDEIRDIEATQKVGIPIIAVTWGLNSKKGLERFSPEFVADRPHDIRSILETL